MEEELFKKLIYFQRVKVFLLDERTAALASSDSLRNCLAFKDEHNSLFLKIPDKNEIKQYYYKYKRVLERSRNSDWNPERSLLRYQQDFINELRNFYDISDGEDKYCLNVFAELKTVKTSDDVVDEPGRDWLGDPPEYPIHKVLDQNDISSSSILKELSIYYDFLHSNIYERIIKTIDMLLDQVAETISPEGKIATTCTVAELALFFRLLLEAEKVRDESKNELYRKIVKCFASQRMDIMSVASFKNNFEKPDPNACREIKILLNQMLERVGRLP